MYQINIPIYKQEAYLLVGTTTPELVEEINLKHENNIDKLESFNARGFQWDTEYKEESGYIKKRFYLAITKTELLDTTLEHEVIHLTWAILEHVGVKINSKNHEAFTYLFEHLLQECRNEIKNLTI